MGKGGYFENRNGGCFETAFKQVGYGLQAEAGLIYLRL